MELFKAQGKTNLVLDLRDNGGGYLHIMQSIASYFCKTSEENRPIVAIADYGERRENYLADGNFYDVLNSVRISAAKRLLRDPSLKIGEIGEMVGYADTAHFARVFKKLVGMSANEYRNTLP